LLTIKTVHFGDKDVKKNCGTILELKLDNIVGTVFKTMYLML